VKVMIMPKMTTFLLEVVGLSTLLSLPERGNNKTVTATVREEGDGLAAKATNTTATIAMIPPRQHPD